MLLNSFWEPLLVPVARYRYYSHYSLRNQAGRRMILANQIATPDGSRPRLISVDDNIRTVGGHFYELATLLLEGAQRHGIDPVLATNACFDGQTSVNSDWPLARVFNTRRMVHWSLGVDGHSKYQRDSSARTIGGTKIQNTWSAMTDKICRPDRRPNLMLEKWASDLTSLLTLCKPTMSDSLLINTGDDFVMLALSTAMKRLNLPFPLRIDVIFHFAVYESTQSDRSERISQFGKQINACLHSLKPHDIRLHATTESLASQMREATLSSAVNTIPYPTRSRAIRQPSESEQPVKIVLAGLPRAEKGRESIATLLQQIKADHLKSRKFRVSMQMPAENWQSMVPQSLHASYERAVAGASDELLEVMTDNLSTAAYHQWLDTADLGLFLYEPQRYVARCSGVLLEMMARGIPVIVPDHCWLADQVRAAGGHRSIGFIYQNRDEIPGLLTQFNKHRSDIQQRATAYAQKIAAKHAPANTISELGIAGPLTSKRVA